MRIKEYCTSKDTLNVGERKTLVDKGNHQHEFEGARKDAEKFAMKYCRKCTAAMRSSRKNGVRVYDTKADTTKV